METITKILSSL